MAVSLLLARYHPPFKGIKITASGELLFRLRWLPEDDTILLNWGVSLRSAFKTVPVGAGAVFNFKKLYIYLCYKSPLAQ